MSVEGALRSQVLKGLQVIDLSTIVAVEFEVVKTWRDSYFAGSRL
jgi:hypothetical protein